MPQNKPLYIVFEGGDGSGKSTQARLLAPRIGAVSTFEPGATESGVRLREILLSPETGDLDPSTELFLMAAGRHQTMKEVVEPNLAKGKTVVSDRSFISSLAYQGAGRGFGIEATLDINLRLGRLRMPDLVFLIGAPSAEEMARRNMVKGKFDKIESAQGGFHARVAEAFGQMAHTLANDGRTSLINVVEIAQEGVEGQKTVDLLQQEIFNELTKFCEERRIIVPGSTQA
jgi:dTMP kinase